MNSQFPECLASAESPEPQPQCSQAFRTVCLGPHTCQENPGLEGEGQGHCLNHSLFPCAEPGRRGFMMLPSRRNLLEQRAACATTAGGAKVDEPKRERALG